MVPYQDTACIGWIGKGMLIHTVVAKETDDSIVAQRDHVEGVTQEEGDPVVPRYDRPQDELDDVEHHPYGKEGSYRYLSPPNTR